MRIYVAIDATLSFTTDDDYAANLSQRGTDRTSADHGLPEGITP